RFERGERSGERFLPELVEASGADADLSGRVLDRALASDGLEDHAEALLRLVGSVETIGEVGTFGRSALRHNALLAAIFLAEPTSGGRDERVDRAAPTARGTLAALLVAPLRGCDDELTSQQNEKLVRQEHAHLAPTTSEGARWAFFMWKLRATRS